MAVAISKTPSATEGASRAIPSNKEGYLDLQYTRSSALDVGVEQPAQDVGKARPFLRATFKYMNRYLMVPAFRLGLGPVMGSPFGGYIMVLKTTGNKSGQPRYAPLNFAILDGNVYCIAGWGKQTHWFANLKADPHVELIMPGAAVAGLAEEVTHPEEARRARVGVARNSGFALMFGGLNPMTATDDQIMEGLGYVPVVRIRPYGMGNGAFDPGGWGWVLPTLAQLAGLLWLVRRIRRGRKQPRQN
jgi:deazaflavin-dependent oxidoreductase (nitroreductase family)